jgi:pimeloyl-ACP methyl ester carboxylesterase
VLGRLGDIQVPTVVLVGDEDDPTTIAGAESVASGVRRGELRLIERAGHLVEIVRADEVARAILSESGDWRATRVSADLR